MIKVLISGIGGKMGTNIFNILKNDEEAQAICGVDYKKPEGYCDIPVYTTFSEVTETPDVIIDFSSPILLKDILEFAKEKKCAVVLATTGYITPDLEMIREASKEIAIFKTANFSIGVNLLVKLVKEAAEFLGESYDVEIVEKHHNQKVDAPSGTALMLADSVNSAFDNKKDYVEGRSGKPGKRGKEIGIHAVRGGTIVGDHDVMFCGQDEVISFSHRADSKKVFANGAVKAAKFVTGKPAGMYDMKDVLSNI